ncbi:MAG: transcriptional regulator [Sphingomonadales bacterium]|nr:transcriptional regulator [Sphingomonadales bacterium]MDE2170253.1 transcriptional regulator [Sphingomonadales bacterium]
MTDYTIRPIRNDEDHRAALAAIESLWDAEPGTDDFDRLDLLTTLVEAYEDKRWPVADLDPIEAIQTALESGEHDRRELAALIGDNRVSEVLARHRALSLSMIRKIEAAWHLPATVLIQEYPLSR